MADSKKAHFSKSPILKIFSWKFLRLVLGLVGLIDAKYIENWQFWKSQFYWVGGHFDFFSKIFFCFIPMKISPNLYGRMDGSKFWCFPWFPENSLLCVILRYTVYIVCFALNGSICTFAQQLTFHVWKHQEGLTFRGAPKMGDFLLYTYVPYFGLFFLKKIWPTHLIQIATKFLRTIIFTLLV